MKANFVKIQELNVYIILKKDGKILVLKRVNEIWEFPGGKVEWGEDPEKTAERECKEESKIVPKQLKFAGITSATYKKGVDDKHSIYLVYFGKTNENDVILSEEHNEYRWLTPDELKYLKLGLNAEPVLEFIEVPE